MDKNKKPSNDNEESIMIDSKNKALKKDSQEESN